MERNVENDQAVRSKNPLNIVWYGILVAIIATTMMYSVTNLSTDLNLAAVQLSQNVQYDLEPDGSAVYRFGNRGTYTITCDNGLPIAWNLPADRMAEDLESVCQKILSHRTASLQ